MSTKRTVTLTRSTSPLPTRRDRDVQNVKLSSPKVNSKPKTTDKTKHYVTPPVMQKTTDVLNSLSTMGITILQKMSVDNFTLILSMSPFGTLIFISTDENNIECDVNTTPMNGSDKLEGSVISSIVEHCNEIKANNYVIVHDKHVCTVIHKRATQSFHYYEIDSNSESSYLPTFNTVVYPLVSYTEVLKARNSASYFIFLEHLKETSQSCITHLNDLNSVFLKKDAEFLKNLSTNVDFLANRTKEFLEANKEEADQVTEDVKDLLNRGLSSGREFEESKQKLLKLASNNIFVTNKLDSSDDFKTSMSSIDRDLLKRVYTMYAIFLKDMDITSDLVRPSYWGLGGELKSVEEYFNSTEEHSRPGLISRVEQDLNARASNTSGSTQNHLLDVFSKQFNA